MQTNLLNHVDLRVRSLREALPFFQALLPAVGYDGHFDGDGDWSGWYAPGEPVSRAFFAIIEDSAHVANANRLAFGAESRAAVDRVAELVAAAGAGAIEGPAIHDEYSDDYYAVFFEDPSGNRFEVLHRGA